MGRTTVRTSTVALVAALPWLAGGPGLHGQPVPGQQQAAATSHAPDLVVVVTVDQLRGDYIDRFAPNLTGGLLRFRDAGIFYPAGEQDHANTSTAPGHST
ncbi:MAG TPA: alkaline phosphatase family protein, partial [Longimicrobiales bacterium]|nr:alkaline phosphatase family protein [Longimicrobiales bacterium]